MSDFETRVESTHYAPFYFGAAAGWLDPSSDRSFPLAGTKAVNKFGKNGDLALNTTEAIWPGGGAFTGFNATGAEGITVVSTQPTDAVTLAGAQVIEISGLDDDFNEVTANVGLTGTDPTTATTQKFRRVNRVRVIQVGSNGSNDGFLTLTQETSGIAMAAVGIGYNQTMQAAYTVPAGYNAYMVNIQAHLVGGSNANCIIRFRSRDPADSASPGFQVKDEFAVKAAGSSSVSRTYALPKGPYAEKSDLYMDATADVNNSEASAGFDLVLVPN